MKNTCLFYNVFQVLNIHLIKISKTEPPDLLFFVVFINFYISRYYFSQIFRTSFNYYYLEKRFCHKSFALNQLTQTPHLLNDQNPLNMTKVFCRCSLPTQMTKAGYIIIPEPTEVWIQHEIKTESNWDRQKPAATKKVL